MIPSLLTVVPDAVPPIPRIFDVEFVPGAGQEFDAATNTIRVAYLDHYHSKVFSFNVTTNLGGYTSYDDAPHHFKREGLDSDEYPHEGQGTEPTPFPDEYSARFDIYQFGAHHSHPDHLPSSSLTNFQPFSVSSTKQVYFSPGNLQYRRSDNAWRFALRQFDFVGTQPSSDYYWFQRDGTVYFEDKKCYNAEATNDSYMAWNWIDLFCWGTSGYDGWPGRGTYPWLTGDNRDISTYHSDFGPPGGSLTGEYANGDWGVYNSAALNGGAAEPVWRTLTDEEWEYLITGRIAADPGNCSFAFAGLPPVDSISFHIYLWSPDKQDTVTFTVQFPCDALWGMILFPDGIATTDSLVASCKYINVTDLAGAYYQSRPTFLVDNWPALEEAGCVFLPGCGYTAQDLLTVSSNSIIGIGSGRYWSSTAGRSFRFKFHDNYNVNGESYVGVWYSGRQGNRSAVRLVRDVVNSAPLGAASGGQQVTPISGGTWN